MKRILLFLPTLLTTLYTIAQTTDKKPFILGYTETLFSKALSEKRILNIYLPEGYNPDDTIRYPVVYLLDGSADEDFIHVAGLYQFNNFPWIDRVPKSIIVGIANTNRKHNFTYPTSVAADKKLIPESGGSASFIRFIEDELQPYINNSYRTAQSKTLIGQSLGGLLATEILLKKPYLFDKYIIVSPSLWWDNGSLLHIQPAFKTSKHKNIQVYIGVGKEGLAPTSQPHVMEVDANLLADKIKKLGDTSSVEVYFDYLPQENHASIGHLAIFNALRMLYPVK